LAELDADCQPRQFSSELDLSMMASLKLPATSIPRSYFMQTFNVQGMSCGHCVKAITQAVQAKDPAADVQIDLSARTVQVQSSLSVDAVIQAIKEEGYEARIA
jgi:copper chaperone